MAGTLNQLRWIQITVLGYPELEQGSTQFQNQYISHIHTHTSNLY